jgi:hypothetical protein
MKKSEEKELEEESQNKRINIDWGRQGGVIIGYVIILMGFFGIIANTMMLNQYGDWISFNNMDRTIIFWTHNTFTSAMLDPTVYTSILIVILILIIVISLIDWYPLITLSILISLFVIFTLDLYWNLFNIVDVVTSGNYYFTEPALAIILLFTICFILTYKEDIPQYGIKTSLWMVPFIITIGFLFYISMFGFSEEPFRLQFGTGEGYLNILILYLTVLSGSLSGMKIKKEMNKKLE